MRAVALVFLVCLVASAGEPDPVRRPGPKPKSELRPVWLVVGPQNLVVALKPLAELRQKQGLEPVLVAGRDVVAAVKRHRPAFLVIVGDHGDPEAAWHMPAKTAPLYRWRKVQPATFATDALWADCPVGRIPARTAAQVAIVVQKTIRYETRPPRLADLRLLGWAGAPGYGGAIDTLATGMFVKTVRDYAPKWAAPWLLSGDANADLCGWPPAQPARFATEMAKGSFLTALAAHANHAAVFSMKFQGRGIWFTGGEVKGTEPAAPMVLLACNCGEFDGRRTTITERLLFQPGGPVAAIGATTESHPLTNFYTGVAMLKVAAKRNPKQQTGPPAPELHMKPRRDGAVLRFGAFWQRTRDLAQKTSMPMIEFALKDVEGKLDAQIDVKKLRRDQQLLYALLGDPALKMRMPRKLDAAIERRDGAWHWKIKKPAGATALHVGVSHPGGGYGASQNPNSPKGRGERLNAANGQYVFQPIKGAGWDGSTEARGTLRLVAVTPDALYVATFR